MAPERKTEAIERPEKIYSQKKSVRSQSKGGAAAPATARADPQFISSAVRRCGPSSSSARGGARRAQPMESQTPPQPLPPLQEAADEPPAPPSPAPTVGEPLLFEIAWEVCWQLGGIYTVLRSKAPAMLQRWGERYCLIGPYNPQTAAVEFEEQPPTGLSSAEPIDLLRSRRYRLPLRPLAHPRPPAGHPARLSRPLQSTSTPTNISSGKTTASPPSHNDGEVNEVVAFGFAVAEFFSRLSRRLAGNRPVIAHFHEWMAGVAVPRIAHLELPIATVFTTHATLLGRYLASDSPDFYNHLPFINPDAEAAKYMIYPRFAIERAAAHAATVFTTVSEVTASEAEKLLGRKPDAHPAQRPEHPALRRPARIPEPAPPVQGNASTNSSWAISSPATPSIWTTPSTSSPAAATNTATRAWTCSSKRCTA